MVGILWCDFEGKLARILDLKRSRLLEWDSSYNVAGVDEVLCRITMSASYTHKKTIATPQSRYSYGHGKRAKKGLE